MFFSGEPGASVPGVRDRIDAAYGARVIDCGSMAEMTPFMNVAGSAETDGMLCWQDIVYTEVCDPQTYPARAVRPARHAGLHAPRAHVAADDPARVSGDLTLWENGPTPCGRTYPRLPQGIFGRIDDMFTIRGENVYPSEIDAVLERAGRLRRRAPHRHHARRRDGRAGDPRRDRRRDATRRAPTRITALRDEAARTLQKMLGLRSNVEIVAPGTFPRTDFKARRVDRRSRSVPRHERAARRA